MSKRGAEGVSKHGGQVLECRKHTGQPTYSPLHCTPFVPSPLVPSPPRSKTSEDDLPIKLPAQEQGLASQCEHQRKPLINVYVFFPVFFLPSLRNLTCLTPQMAWNHHLRDHKPTYRASTCTPSYPTPGSTTPPSPTTSHSRPPRAPLSIAPCTRPSQPSHCAAGDGAIDPSQLACRPALAEATLGRRGRTDRIATDVLHRQRRQKRKAKSSAALTNLAMLTPCTRIFTYSALLAITGHTLPALWITLFTIRALLAA